MQSRLFGLWNKAKEKHSLYPFKFFLIVFDQRLLDEITEERCLWDDLVRVFEFWFEHGGVLSDGPLADLHCTSNREYMDTADLKS